MAAYRHLSAIGDSDKAHDVLVGPALELVHRGDSPRSINLHTSCPIPRDVDDANLALDLAIVTYLRRRHPRVATLVRPCRVAPEDRAPTARRRAGRRQDDLVLRLHDMRCAIALLEADLDGAIEGIEIHRQLVSKSRSVPVFEEQFPILAARVMLAARRIRDADEWIGQAERIAGPDIVTRVSVPTLRAWREWMFGRLDISTRLIDDALDWMDDHHIGAHHLAFDTLITGWLVPPQWRRHRRGRAIGAPGPRRCRHPRVRLESPAGRVPVGAAGTRHRRPRRRVADRRRPSFASHVRELSAVHRPHTRPGNRSACSERTRRRRRAAHRRTPTRAAQSSSFRLASAAPNPTTAEELLAHRETWPVLEWQQAELVLAARRDRTWPSNELVALLSSCAETGWVLAVPRDGHPGRAVAAPGASRSAAPQAGAHARVPGADESDHPADRATACG